LKPSYNNKVGRIAIGIACGVALSFFYATTVVAAGMAFSQITAAIFGPPGYDCPGIYCIILYFVYLATTLVFISRQNRWTASGYLTGSLIASAFLIWVLKHAPNF
jgi:hypothetical protein